MVIPLDSLACHEIKQIFAGRKFRIRTCNGVFRLRNRYNLMIQEDKANLIDDIRGKEYEEIRRYLDTGTKYDLREV